MQNINRDTKALVFYSLLILLFVAYFANFTDSVKYTIIGTNLGRFLLQVVGVFLPVYCAAALHSDLVNDQTPA